MAKVSRSDRLMSDVEKLLIGLIREATIGDLKNPDGMTIAEGPSFSEKLKVAATASGFLATKAKIMADEPDQPSEFEEVLSELRGKTSGNANSSQKTRGRKRSGVSGSADESNVIPLRDPLPPDGADPFTVNGHVYSTTPTEPPRGAAE